MGSTTEDLAARQSTGQAASDPIVEAATPAQKSLTAREWRSDARTGSPFGQLTFGIDPNGRTMIFCCLPSIRQEVILMVKALVQELLDGPAVAFAEDVL